MYPFQMALLGGYRVNFGAKIMLLNCHPGLHGGRVALRPPRRHLKVGHARRARDAERQRPLLEQEEPQLWREANWEQEKVIRDWIIKLSCLSHGLVRETGSALSAYLQASCCQPEPMRNIIN